MELRSRTRLQLRRAAMTAALGALLVPATAGAATKKKLPVITKVAPKSAAVGDKLTIYGKNFRKGKAKNRVLFKGAHGKTIFVKAGLSTAKKLSIAVPKSLEKYMTVRDDKPVATRFRIRVLSTKLSKAYTSMGRSPVIGPEKPKNDGGGAVPLDPNADADGDGLTNSFETGVLTTDPLKADTDGDGVGDGFEFASAVDLNNDDYRNPTTALPYPGKRPYPNPLDAADAKNDFDGDSLTLTEEYSLWKYTVAHGGSASLSNLGYSDGLKYSVYGRDGTGRRIPALPAANYPQLNDFVNWLSISGYGTVQWRGSSAAENLLDLDRSHGVESAAGNRYGDARWFQSNETNWLDTHGANWSAGPDGWLSDDERDEDADGLSNYTETHGPMQPQWWSAFYPNETAYPIVYAGTDLADSDSDGDGVRDGADDQDHDDISNLAEVSRNMASGRVPGSPANANPWWGRVNPFNPCLPDTGSRTCPIYVPAQGAWAPFDDSPDYDVVQ
jgi:hypothetical protein